MRFSEIAQAIPQLSDRLLSERMKELEARGIVERHVHATRRRASSTSSPRWARSSRRRCSS